VEDNSTSQSRFQDFKIFPRCDGHLDVEDNAYPLERGLDTKKAKISRFQDLKISRFQDVMALIQRRPKHFILAIILQKIQIHIWYRGLVITGQDFKISRFQDLKISRCDGLVITGP